MFKIKSNQEKRMEDLGPLHLEHFFIYMHPLLILIFSLFWPLIQVYLMVGPSPPPSSIIKVSFFGVSPPAPNGDDVIYIQPLMWNINKNSNRELTFLSWSTVFFHSHKFFQILGILKTLGGNHRFCSWSGIKGTKHVPLVPLKLL